MIFTTEFVGLPLTLGRITRLGVTSRSAVEGALDATGKWGVDHVFALAPVDEDEYRHTLGYLIERSPTETRVRAGTGEPFGARLELGYEGLTDRLGRTFTDINLPVRHFGPVADQWGDVLARELRRRL